MKPIDTLGLKNFRVFDDQKGFREDFSAINILTGANNSGKSSIVKALQMLKNSTSGYRYPFDLDLNQQEHLLGDFENVLYSKDNKRIEVTLPFLFIGIKTLVISLTFEVLESNNTYEATLRGIEVTDKTDDQSLFSFHYRDATDEEKEAYQADFLKKQETYERESIEMPTDPLEYFTSKRMLLFPPSDNPLEGYVEWKINLEKLKNYLTYLREFYKIYLDKKKEWDEEELERIDAIEEVQKFSFVPSEVLKSFKNDLDIEKWNQFVENSIADKKEISGQEHVGERDYDAEDFFYPAPKTEDILYQNTLHILRRYLVWENKINEEESYSVLEHCFRGSWDGMIQRVSTINYISNIKEENSRSYNAASNSPFVNLLKRYLAADIDTAFIREYLQAFQIGKELIIQLQPKYQSIFVSIMTTDNQRRELVDFGYGIKQVVLILIQISVLAQKIKRIKQRYGYDGDYDYEYYEPSVLIIEEPEANLHPKWQSLLAKMLVEANKKFNIQLIIETHSEYLIKKLQTLVADKKAKPKDIKLFYLRTKDKVKAGKKQVESMHIEEDGSIDYKLFDDGFFDENYNLEMSLLNIRRDKFFREFEDLKNSNKDNEDKIEDLQQKIDDFTNKADLSVYEQIITQRFDVTKLAPFSEGYLVSGQYLLAHIKDTSDFSPVIMQYGRAIENELKHIFNAVDSSKNWMLGDMQGNLQLYKGGPATVGMRNHVNQTALGAHLSSIFINPVNIRIGLLHDLRDIRNSAGHPGHTKTRQEALDYITKANEFLDSWIAEKR